MKNKKRKPTKAQRELAAEWEAIQKKWDNVPKFARSGSPTGRIVEPHRPAFQELPMTQRPRSLVTPGGSTEPTPTQIYTGNNLVGIAVMHKSNLVPVFSQEQAVDTAQMRRG